MNALIIALAVTAAPSIGKDFKLNCPAGTSQFGGPTSHQAVLTCVRTAADGTRTYVGPYYSFYKSGAVEAQGQVEEGFRSGKWSFFDEKGTLTGDTEFKHGDFHGRRTFYHPDGSIRSVEVYLEGRRQLR
jgi:hypothetical protein